MKTALMFFKQRKRYVYIIIQVQGKDLPRRRGNAWRRDANIFLLQKEIYQLAQSK